MKTILARAFILLVAAAIVAMVLASCSVNISSLPKYQQRDREVKKFERFKVSPSEVTGCLILGFCSYSLTQQVVNPRSR